MNTRLASSSLDAGHMASTINNTAYLIKIIIQLFVAKYGRKSFAMF